AEPAARGAGRPRARQGPRRRGAGRGAARSAAPGRAVERRHHPPGSVRPAGVGAGARPRAGAEAVMVDELPVFDICGPLPEGTTLLEASAGTGKTWTIGALCTRFVAEGVARLDEMLV